MMKSYRKSSLSLALGVVLGSMALVPALSHAYSVNNNNGQVTTDGGGDTLLFPFYTTANGSTTSFSVSNTSSATIAAKVRFREQVNSEDVRDFIVVLSPDDKFDFWVAPDVNNGGKPAVFWNDNSCVVGKRGPIDGVKTLPLVDEINRRPVNPTVGHVEVIGMIDLTNVHSEGYSLAVAAKHDEAGVPTNCNPIYNAFENRAKVNALTDERDVEILSQNLAAFDVPNALIGAYVVTAGAAGIEGGDVPVVIQNTFNRAVLAAQSPELCAGTGFDSTNQDREACFQLYTWDAQEEDHPHLGDINWVSANQFDNSVVANMDGALTALALRGDWSNNPANRVGYDWITTYPTKYVYLDDCDNDGVPDEDGNLGDKLVGQYPFCQTPSPFGPGGHDRCMGKASVDAFDTEEGVPSRPSPSIEAVWGDCKETNVFTYFMATEQCDPKLPAEELISRGCFEPTLIQTEGLREHRAFEYIPSVPVRGWIDQPLVWQPNAVVPTHTRNQFDGAATQGLIWIVRSTDDASVNNGSLRELDRERAE